MWLFDRCGLTVISKGLATQTCPCQSALRKKTAAQVHKRPAPDAVPLDSKELYLNPHLSLLDFQRRVLEEAHDEATPLLERVKFVSILGSNIDEFFMVRVAGLWQQIETRTTEISMDGRSPGEQLELIRHAGDCFRQ